MRKTSCENAIKYISNSISGRFLMNVPKYSEDIDIVTNSEKIMKLAGNAYFKRAVPLNDGQIIVIHHKNYSQVNHPNYIGYYILELSNCDFTIYFTTS